MSFKHAARRGKVGGSGGLSVTGSKIDLQTVGGVDVTILEFDASDVFIVGDGGYVTQIDGSAINLNGPVDILDTLDVTGAVTLDSTLTVAGATVLNSALDVAGITSLTDLNVSGDTQMDGNLNVDGDVTFNGAFDLNITSLDLPNGAHITWENLSLVKSTFLEFNDIVVESSGDAEWSQAQFLHLCDGVDGFNTDNTTFTEDQNATAIQFDSNAAYSDAEKPFTDLTTSLECDGTSDWTSYLPNSAWDLLTDDFTIEIWIKPRTGFDPAVSNPVFFSKYSNVGTREWIMRWNSGDLRFAFTQADNNTGDSRVVSATKDVTDGEWHHVAVCRQGTNLYLLADGVLLDSRADMSTDSIHATASAIRLGGEQFSGVNGTAWDGWLSNARITVGTARYTGSYTVPTKSFGIGELTPGSTSAEFTVGDPVYDTIIEGLTTRISSVSTDIDGTLNVDGEVNFEKSLQVDGSANVDGLIITDTGLVSSGIILGGTTLEVLGAATLGSTLDVTGAITAASYDGVLAANLLDKTADETISGSYAFAALSGTTGISLEKTAATEEVRVDFLNENGTQKWTVGCAATTADNFILGRYNESGVFQNSPIDVDSATGLVTLASVDFTDPDEAIENLGITDAVLENLTIGIGANAAITTGSLNIAFGTNALNDATTATKNIGIGNEALSKITVAAGLGGLIAIGQEALSLNTTGIYNVAIGLEALKVNVGGSYNTAIGIQTLLDNTSGNRNLALGAWALYENTTGSENSGVGYGTLFKLKGAAEGNTALGSKSLFENITGDYNTGLGYESLRDTTGSGNTGVGVKALDNVTTGSQNIGIGYFIDAQSATGSYQLSIGNLIFGTNVDGVGTTVATGRIGITEVNPAAKLDVIQGSQSAAIPVLELHQADIDDTFINFVGTSAADSSRSISSSTATASAKFGAVRIEINGTTKWLRVYDSAV